MANTRDEISVLIQRIQDFHAQDAMRSLGDAIKKKKKWFGIVLYIVDGLSKSLIGNCFLICLVVLFYRVFRRGEPGCDVFFYGMSENNLRAFSMLEKCFPDGLPGQCSINGKSFSIFFRLKVLFSIFDILTVSKVMSERQCGKPLARLQAIIGCAAYLLYKGSRFLDETKVVCVASDHSPICQALLFQSELRGVKTCYIQHAPVTENFPPLNYDLSILYDQASYESYVSSARINKCVNKGEVLLLSPFSSDFVWPKLEGDEFFVGLCLSFLPRLDVLAEFIKEIKSNDRVSGLLIRRHPRCKMDLSVLKGVRGVVIQKKDENISDFFEAVDLVVVPNSGVAIESLHNGKPTFYLPGSDYIEDDYYGFVAAGVIPSIDVGMSCDSERIEKFFNDAWAETYGRYDETAKRTIPEMRSEVRKAFLNIYGN
ncbi:hypothetical protein [Alloalcanivorax xenomutans]|uniref:hypothetical protein n=1 Tax=Alloalcanivorax xenomutans TaxID=1094342 RepID=UPI003BAA3A05